PQKPTRFSFYFVFRHSSTTTTTPRMLDRQIVVVPHIGSCYALLSPARILVQPGAEWCLGVLHQGGCVIMFRCRFAVVVMILLLVCAHDATGQGKQDKIRIGYAARAVAHSVPFVAREAGFFAEEGIDAEIVRTAGSIAPMALVANEVDLAIMSAYLMIPVAVQNKDVVMLGGFSRYASMVFVARPDVRGPQDLKGKIVGIQRPGDAYEKSARFALRHLGLDADKDVKMLALGTNDVMWSALQTGRVSATILSPPGTLFARKAGMNFMVDLTDLKLEYQGSTIATRRSFVQKNPHLATRALRAIVRGVHLFKTRKEDTMRI